MEGESRPVIDHAAPEPLYVQVAAWVRERVDSGEWEHNRKLPAERDLGPMWGIGYETVRRMMALLREQGYIMSVQGRGTFVRDPRRQPGNDRPPE